MEIACVPVQKRKKNSCRDEELNSALFWSAVTCFKGPIDLGWPFIWFWPNTAPCSHVHLPNKPYNLGIWIFFFTKCSGKKDCAAVLGGGFYLGTRCWSCEHLRCCFSSFSIKAYVLLDSTFIFQNFPEA